MDLATLAAREGEDFKQDGDFGYWVEHAQIAAVSWCGQEIIRRLFVTVRDRNWRETPATEWEAKPLQDGRGVTLKALHRGPLVEFKWEGTFSVHENTLSFKIDGRTLRDMEICRLGLVVLYPVRGLLGSHVQIEGPQGTHSLQIHEQLYPQPIVDNLPCGMTPPFSSLSINLPKGGDLQCHFSGDLFELEDQRNWGDASFKAYCTPLSLGFPRQVTKGTVIRHQVEATLARPAPSNGAQASSIYEIRRPDDVPRLAFRFPRLGMVAPAETQPGRESPYTHWSHISLNVIGSESYPSVTRVVETLPPSTDIELCLTVDENGTTNHLLTELFKRTKSRIIRVLLRGAGSTPPSERSVARLRESLSRANIPTLPLWVTTNGHFVDINRDQPLPRLEGVAFPFSSSVHLIDRWTIAESPAALGDMVASARKLAGQSNIAISPLALFRPPRADTDIFPRSIVVPWTLATLIASATSQISSLTFAADLVATLSAADSRLLGRLQTWSSRPMFLLASREWNDVYAARVDGGKHADEVIFINLRRTPIEIRWRDTEFQFRGPFVDLSTGSSIHPREPCSLRLAPASVIIAET